MKKWISLLLSAAMILGIFFACSTSGTDATQTQNMQASLQTAVENLTANLTANPVSVQETDGTAVMAFGLNLLQQTAGEENATLSPLSAYLALALAANGTEGQTNAQFQQLLGQDVQQMNNMARGLMNRLTQTGGSTTVQLANSVWLQNGFPANGDFLQEAVDYFDADIFTADLPTQQAMEAVNDWVSEKTNGEIEGFLEQSPNTNAVMLLFNALYFDAKWQTPFETNSTQIGDFTTASGQAVSCEFMMDRENPRPYFTGTDFDGVVLPYDCGQYALVAIRPTAGQSLEELLKHLDAEQLQTALDGAQPQVMTLRLPKFSFETTTQMNLMLQDMGLTDAFTDQADFSALTTDDSVYISQVLQKVKIDVMEDGTRAAAATEIEITKKSMMISQAVEISFDQPFAYAIVDTETQTPLFMGTVTNPAG